jgi:hypothetical protein
VSIAWFLISFFFFFYYGAISVLSDAMIVYWTQQADPELAQVILGNDLNKLQDLLRQRHRQRSELHRQQEEEFVST